MGEPEAKPPEIISRTMYVVQHDLMDSGRWVDGCHGHGTMLDAIACRDRAADATKKFGPLLDAAFGIQPVIPVTRIIKRMQTDEVLEVFPAESVKDAR